MGLPHPLTLQRMKITWYGHAAFLIETEGIRIILDPYHSPDCGGYAPIDESADIVSISHENVTYHSNLEAVTGHPVLLDGLSIAGSEMGTRDILFSSVRVYEDEQNNGPNAMVSFESEGLRITHMGDCGHPLNTSQSAAIAGTDILLALAGGPPTIELSDLRDLMDHLKPRVTIPMHFGNDKINLPIQPVEDFLALFPKEKIGHAGSSSISVTTRNISSFRPVMVLNPAR